MSEGKGGERITDRIRVNTGSLGRIKENVSAQIRQIREQIGAVYDEIDALNAMWEGEACRVFDSEFRKDVRRLEKLCKSLDEIVSYENYAIAEYERCEKEVALVICDIKV